MSVPSVIFDLRPFKPKTGTLLTHASWETFTSILVLLHLLFFSLEHTRDRQTDGRMSNYITVNKDNAYYATAPTFFEAKRRQAFDWRLVVFHKLVQLLLKPIPVFTQYAFIVSAIDRRFVLLSNQHNAHSI